jgi:predicted nucleic acid-binding protein
MIVVDTGGIIALLNSEDRHHGSLIKAYESSSRTWSLPWAILPEVDYIATTRLGVDIAAAFSADVRDGLFRVDANVQRDMPRAVALLEQYRDLRLGLVDAVVMAQAERLKARAIVTTDERHFRAVRLKLEPAPRLLPFD